MKELLHGSFLPADSIKESFPQKAAQFVLKNAATRLLPVSVLIFAGCSGGGGEKNNTQELENKESSGYSLPFPKGETWYLTTGPHGDGNSNGIKYAIDIAPPEGGFCPPDGRKFTIDNRVVTASASGEVIIKGDDRNRNDPFHSEIRIKDKNGLTQTYIHLDNTQKVKVGNKVKQGDPLGNPSCEFPPGGANTGPHVHVGLMKDGQAIPIDGVVVGGWTIHEGVNGQEGTMTKEGEKTRTANAGRYADVNGEIRNDLPNDSNRAVVASPKDPISPISATITSKEVFPTTATPTATTKKETPNAPSVLCHVTTDPVEYNMTPGKTEIIKANVDSGLKDAKISEMRFGSYNTEVATVNPTSDPNSPYSTTVTALKDGESAVWGTAFLDDGRVCQSSGNTDTDINVSAEKQIEQSKISISKKPDELFKSLLVTPIQQVDLPAGMVSKGASVGQLDETSKALDAIGQVTISIAENDPRFYGAPNGAISYIIFTNSTDAKGAYSVVSSSLNNSYYYVIEDSVYQNTVSIQPLYGGLLYVGIVAIRVDNVLIATVLTEVEQANLESKILALTSTALKQLEKVGR